MQAKLAVLMLAILTVAGCAAPPKQVGPIPPAAPEPEETATAPATPPEPEAKPLPPVDVRKLTCATLNSANDDDKAYASTFLLGYRAGLMRAHVLDTKKIDAVEQAAVAECATNPAAIAARVFAVAQLKAELAEHPQRHMVYRRAAVAPVATTPQAARAPTPDEATQPPMRYAPAQPQPPATEASSPAAEAQPAAAAEQPKPADSTAEKPASSEAAPAVPSGGGTPK